jgi:NADH-quinone oxidoreductase subunit N
VACGFYYYLKIVRAMYWQAPTDADKIPVNPLSRATMSALIVATIWLGIYPWPILEAAYPRHARVALRSTMNR